jgi:hypothetical protein
MAWFPYEQGMPNRLLSLTGQYTGQIQEDSMAKIIGTYEARTHWSEVIQEVKKGNTMSSPIMVSPSRNWSPLAPKQSRNGPNVLLGSCLALWPGGLP